MKILKSIELGSQAVPQNTVMDLIIPGKIEVQRLKIANNKTLSSLKDMRALREYTV